MKKKSLIAMALAGVFMAAAAGGALMTGQMTSTQAAPKPVQTLKQLTGSDKVEIFEAGVACNRYDNVVYSLEEIPDATVRAVCVSNVSTGRTVIRDTRWEGGERHNPNGPAVVETDLETGIVTNIEYYIHGKHQDAPDGTPAIQRFNPEGVRIYLSYQQGGLRHNGPKGEPAIQRFSNEGKLIRAEYWDGYNRVAGPNGEPALREFDAKGAVTYTEIWDKGTFISKSGAKAGAPAPGVS